MSAMDSFYDDSSSAMRLDHGSTLRDARAPAATGRVVVEVQTSTGGWVRGVHQDEENEAHFRESLQSGIFDWIIEHLRRDPDTRKMRPSDRERTAYIRYLSIAAAAHDRVRAYVELHHLDFSAAVMKAESDIVQAEEIEQFELVTLARKPKDAYLGDSIESLMAHETSGKGGGSKSKSHESARIADAPVVEQALRKREAA